MERDDVIQLIIFGLFRDGEFHGLDEKQGAEFYIDLLDEALVNDVDFNFLLEQLIASGDKRMASRDKGFAEIVKPCLDTINETLEELEQNGWIKLEKKTTLEVFEKGRVGKELYKGAIIGGGKLLTYIVKITAKEITWSKFIEYVSDRYEKGKMDWDNIYSFAKQESLTFGNIEAKKTELDRDEDIIVPLEYLRFGEIGRVQVLKTLLRMEGNGLIVINGFKIYDSEHHIKEIKGVPPLFALKAKLSVTQKFRDVIKKRYREFEESFGLNRKKASPNRAGEQAEIRPKLRFDSMVGTLRYGDIAHSFHRGERGEEKRLMLFKKLWEEKRFIKNGIVKAQGKPFPPESLSIQLGITEDARDFARNAKAKDGLFALVKGVNRVLRNKKFPARIERKNGIQLVVTER